MRFFRSNSIRLANFVDDLLFNKNPGLLLKHRFARISASWTHPLPPTTCSCGMGGGGCMAKLTSQPLTLAQNLPKNPNFLCPVAVGERGGEQGTRLTRLIFQLLMLSPNLPKTQTPYVCLRWLGTGVNFPTFDAESKTQIPYV